MRGAFCVVMPPRRRHRGQVAPPPPTDVERFAQLVKEQQEAKRAAELAKLAARQAAAELLVEEQKRAAARRQHEIDLAEARVDHTKAVERAREARKTGRAVPQADAAWRAATARLIELESGEAPAWAPRPDLPQVDETVPEPNETVGELVDLDGSVSS